MIFYVFQNTVCKYITSIINCNISFLFYSFRDSYHDTMLFFIYRWTLIFIYFLFQLYSCMQLQPAIIVYCKFQIDSFVRLWNVASFSNVTYAQEIYLNHYSIITSKWFFFEILKNKTILLGSKSDNSILRGITFWNLTKASFWSLRKTTMPGYIICNSDTKSTETGFQLQYSNLIPLKT